MLLLAFYNQIKITMQYRYVFSRKYFSLSKYRNERNGKIGEFRRGTNNLKNKITPAFL